MALVTLQTIFQDAFPAYEQSHALPAHVRRATRAIMPCRTAALGGHVQACPDGHVLRIWYNSCRHRSCPQCATLQTEHWLALQPARLLACDHSHVILTLPHALNPLWLANVPVISTLLQRVRLHVPLPQTRGVRSSGLSHHTHAEALAHCRTALGQPPVEVPACLDWQAVCAQWGDAHPARCPMCGQLLVCTGVIPCGGAPPVIGAGERAA